MVIGASGLSGGQIWLGFMYFKAYGMDVSTWVVLSTLDIEFVTIKEDIRLRRDVSEKLD
jgi:hypothetical protein